MKKITNLKCSVLYFPILWEVELRFARADHLAEVGAHCSLFWNFYPTGSHPPILAWRSCIYGHARIRLQSKKLLFFIFFFMCSVFFSSGNFGRLSLAKHWTKKKYIQFTPCQSY
jgi:hypothetical protein